MQPVTMDNKILLNMAINNTENSIQSANPFIPYSKEEFIKMVTNRFELYKQIHSEVFK